jgi:hypothetical protein
MTAMENFRMAMSAPTAPREPHDIGVLLGACVRRFCEEKGLVEAEVWEGGPLVTMFLTPSHPWEAVIIGPNAYQLYPGFVNGDHVAWPNIWVADNYSLDKLIRELGEAIETAAAEEAKV